jgi:hypothetical protein
MKGENKVPDKKKARKKQEKIGNDKNNALSDGYHQLEERIEGLSDVVDALDPQIEPSSPTKVEPPIPSVSDPISSSSMSVVILSRWLSGEGRCGLLVS